MLDLDHTLATVRERIAKYERQSIGEQDTKAALIAPVLRALGWDLEDLEDVKLEYRRRPADNPVDYALFLLRTPCLFIEAKPLGAGINDGKWASQILAYATVAGVEWVALTDGNVWRIYNSHALVPVEQKLFRSIRVADPSTRPGETLTLLSKAGLGDKIIETLWKTEVVDRRVRPALEALFAPDLPPDFLRFVHRRVPELTISDVRASLARARILIDYPAVAIGRRPVVATPPKTTPSPTLAATTETPTSPVGSGTPWRKVTLAELIRAGLVALPFAIEHHYLGTDLRARIDAADRIVFNGDVYDSLSIAGGVARASAAGPRKGSTPPSTNGWTFWQFRSADGGLHQLDDLRRELFERGVVSLADERQARRPAG